MADPRGFHYADYIVFVITIVISVGIGFYYAFSGNKQKTTSEYLVGGRSMQIIPITLSLMVSFESSIMMLGFPAEVYTHGMMFWLASFGFMFVMLIGAKMIVPLIHPLKITSVYEYLALRYNSKAVRTLGSTVAVLNTVLYMGVVLFGPAIALQAVMGFPLVGSMAIVATASIVYTSIGGFKAVVWTDVFQTLIMFMGIFAVLIKGTMEVGGVTEVIRYSGEGGRLDMWNFSPDPTIRHSFWTLVIGITIRTFGLAVGQATIQRISSTPTQKDAKLVMNLVGPLFWVTFTIAMLQGLVAFAYYSKIGCDPLANGQITNPNQVMPLLVLDLFPSFPGMPGLFMASLFSASLSTLSSGLSALSAQTVEDYVMPFMSNKSDRTRTILAKVSVVVYGLCAVAVSMVISTVGGSLSQIAFGLMSSFIGPLTGLILMSVLVPFVNYKGALAGVICSIGLTLWVTTGSYSSKTLMTTPPLPPAPVYNCPVTNDTISPYNYTLQSLASIEAFEHYEPEGIDKLYSMSYLWLAGFAILIVFSVGIVVSYFTGPIKPEDSDPRYTVSVFDEFCCCLPETVLKPLRCGVDYNKKKTNQKRDVYEEDIELNSNGVLITHNAEYHAHKENIDHDTPEVSKEEAETLLQQDGDQTQSK